MQGLRVLTWELKKNISVIPTLLRKEFYSSKIISDINEEIKLKMQFQVGLVKC